jgi:hypothetical protein
MRRTDLERELRARGWEPTGEMSGERHTIWRHPEHPHAIYVPTEDIVIDAVGAAVLDMAEG